MLEHLSFGHLTLKELTLGQLMFGHLTLGHFVLGLFKRPSSDEAAPVSLIMNLLHRSV